MHLCRASFCVRVHTHTHTYIYTRAHAHATHSRIILWMPKRSTKRKLGLLPLNGEHVSWWGHQRELTYWVDSYATRTRMCMPVRPTFPSDSLAPTSPPLLRPPFPFSLYLSLSVFIFLSPSISSSRSQFPRASWRVHPAVSLSLSLFFRMDQWMSRRQTRFACCNREIRTRPTLSRCRLVIIKFTFKWAFNGLWKAVDIYHSWVVIFYVENWKGFSHMRAFYLYIIY